MLVVELWSEVEYSGVKLKLKVENCHDVYWRIPKFNRLKK